MALFAGLPLACGGPGDGVTSGATERDAGRLPSDDECVQCHVEVGEEWARSRHHSSFTNADFQRAYAREALPFCRECHAPALARLPASEAEARGVGCLDCHLGGAAIVTGGDAAAASAAPHPLRRDPRFATEVCARCHEFDFPPGSGRPPGTMMQMTMREHRASAYADRSCADCHMPRARYGGSRHDFASTRDPAAMRRALEVQATREGDALVLDLRTNEVGHGFPTGDLFRRLAVHAELVVPDRRVIAHEVRYLARHFLPLRYPDGRLRQAASEPVVDDRVHGAARVRLDLAPDAMSPGAELVWWIDLERVDERDQDHPERSTVAGTIRLAGGRIPAPQSASLRP